MNRQKSAAEIPKEEKEFKAQKDKCIFKPEIHKMYV